MTNWLNQTATYSYDNAGRLTSFVNFNGTITSYTYDSANRLTSLSTSKSDTTPLLNYAFTLDSNGNRTETLQLEPLSPTISLGTTAYVYNNTNNRLTSFNGLTLSYDNEGQTTTGTAGTYGYDYEHRLVSAPGITYSYDGRGNRLKAVRYGAETHYVYDASGNLLAETDNAGNIIQYYIYGAGLLAMVDNAGNIYCYHFNALGSTIALTNSSQAVVNTYAYTPFGVVTEQQTVNQPFKYVGQYGVMAEPNGLYYMRARYYDPSVGRFISEDPSGFSGGDTNLYAYVEGNPIGFTDPLGLWKYAFTAGAHLWLPVSILPVSGGGSFSSDYSSNGQYSSSKFTPEVVVGEYADAGVSAGFSDISNSNGQNAGATFSINGPLMGKYGGAQITFQKDISLTNPSTWIPDGVQVGLGVGASAPVTYTAGGNLSGQSNSGANLNK